MKRMRVVLADDNRVVLDSVERFLTTTEDFDVEIVGRARSGDEAIQCSHRLHPDLVLMDISMPNTGGLEATRSIKKMSGAPQVIMLTIYESDEYRRASLAAGADGFIAKSELFEGLRRTLRSLFPEAGSTGRPHRAEIHGEQPKV